MVWGFETDPEILAELRIGHPVILEVRCGLALGKVVRISGRKVNSLHKTVSSILDQYWACMKLTRALAVPQYSTDPHRVLTAKMPAAR